MFHGHQLPVGQHLGPLILVEFRFNDGFGDRLVPWEKRCGALMEAVISLTTTRWDRAGVYKRPRSQGKTPDCPKTRRSDKACFTCRSVGGQWMR